MEVREAVKMAKEHISELYEGEHIRNVGLEEVVLSGGVWKVTVGFSRPWDFDAPNLFGHLQDPPRRTYKVVQIDNQDGRIVSVMSHSADVSN